MPNAAARRAKKAQTATDDNHTTGVTVTDTLTAGDFKIETLGDSYEFTRQGAGRKRVPSPFDNVIEQLVGAGTQRLAVDNDEQAQQVIKDLQKSAEYHKRGLEKRVENMDDGLFVVFRINPEKAARAPRKSREDAVESAETE